MVSEDILSYCAEEVTRQRDKPLAVYWMCKAWKQAQEDRDQLVTPGLEHVVLTPDLIASWGILVQPEKNPRGFRRVDVVVGERSCPSWERVPYLMAQFCSAVREEGFFIPSEAYREFEEIHPFRDGNGRVGKILYNFLLGSLDNPQWPPNFFGISNP